MRRGKSSGCAGSDGVGEREQKGSEEEQRGSRRKWGWRGSIGRADGE